MATLRKSTSLIVAVRVPDHENDGRVREVLQAGRRQAEEEMLSQQAALQALPPGAQQGAQGRAAGHPRQGPGEGVQTRQEVLTWANGVPSGTGPPVVRGPGTPPGRRA